MANQKVADVLNKISVGVVSQMSLLLSLKETKPSNVLTEDERKCFKDLADSLYRVNVSVIHCINTLKPIPGVEIKEFGEKNS